MKNQRNRISAILALALVAFGISASLAMGQTAARGSFTLPFEVRWNSAVLPAGDYTFNMRSTAFPAQMILEGPNGRIFILGMVVSDEETGQGSSLTVNRRGGTRFVKDLYLANSGKRISYWEPKPPKDELLAQGPTTTEAIRVSIGR